MVPCKSAAAECGHAGTERECCNDVVLEGECFNGDDPVGNDQAGQVAVVECTLFDGHHAFGNGDAGEQGRFFKRAFSDRLNLVAERNAG